MVVLLCLMAAAAGAVAFRIRGGWAGDLWGWPGQASRFVYAGIMASLLLALGWPWPVEGWRLGLLWLALVAGWFLGAVVVGTFGAIDAGRNEGSRERDFFLNTARGVIYALPPAIVLAALALSHGDTHRAASAVWLVAAGLWLGACYDAAWTFFSPPAHQPTVIAEFAFGAFLGAGAALAVLA